MARSSTVLSIDMVSGSYAAHLMLAVQNIALLLPGTRRFTNRATGVWSICGGVHVIIQSW
jgi:hypothetical protein